MADMFDFQDRITERVAVEVEPHIQSAEVARSRWNGREASQPMTSICRRWPSSRTRPPSENAEAYALLTGALALEPDNALLLAHAAWVLDHRGAMGWPPFGPDDMQKCAELARRGLLHAAGNPTVMAQCGLALLQAPRNTIWGWQCCNLRRRPTPTICWSLSRQGSRTCIAAYRGCPAHFHRALRLSPRDPFAFIALTGIAHAQMVLGDYLEVLVWATRSLGLNPTFDPTLWMLIAANAHLGRMGEARRFLDELKRLAPASR